MSEHATAEEPRTEAHQHVWVWTPEWWGAHQCDVEWCFAILESPPVDWEAMRMEKHWPTPDSMRSAADALDALVIPRYGDILRWVADACDASLPEPKEQD